MQRIVQLRGGEAPALVAALGTVVLWSSAFVGIRSAGRSLSPEALALGRLLVSSVALGAFAAVRRERLPAQRDLARIASYGVLWLVVYNIVLNEAERRVDAGTAAMLVNIGPILIALLAGLLLREASRAACSAVALSPSPVPRSSLWQRPTAVAQRAGEQCSASSQPSRTPRQ